MSTSYSPSSTGSSIRARPWIVVEHHLAVIAHGDWIIDMGPGAGHDGGQVVFEGTPSRLVERGCSLTGKHLRRYVGEW